MADIVRRDPFDAAFGLNGGFRQMMDRMLNEPFFHMPVLAHGWDEGTLPVDISEADGKLTVRASLPGYAKEDIDVQVDEGVLSIKAQHTEETETKDEKYYRRERRTGSVSRRIALPGIVHEAPVDAELKDGVLTLSIAVPEQAKPKQIEIKTA
jgi:HSP20 family protein